MTSSDIDSEACILHHDLCSELQGLLEKEMEQQVQEIEENDMYNMYNDMDMSFDLTFMPTNMDVLQDHVESRIKAHGPNVTLDRIYLSGMRSLSGFFNRSKILRSFNGDISSWDLSNVKDTSNMFKFSKFNGDISGWDMSNVTDTAKMFFGADFQGDISGWDMSNVSVVRHMFGGNNRKSRTEYDISRLSKWSFAYGTDVSKILHKKSKQEFPPSWVLRSISVANIK